MDTKHGPIDHERTPSHISIYHPSRLQFDIQKFYYLAVFLHVCGECRLTSKGSTTQVAHIQRCKFMNFLLMATKTLRIAEAPVALRTLVRILLVVHTLYVRFQRSQLHERVRTNFAFVRSLFGVGAQVLC